MFKVFKKEYVGEISNTYQVSLGKLYSYLESLRPFFTTLQSIDNM